MRSLPATTHRPRPSITVVFTRTASIELASMWHLIITRNLFLPTPPSPSSPPPSDSSLPLPSHQHTPNPRCQAPAYSWPATRAWQLVLSPSYSAIAARHFASASAAGQTAPVCRQPRMNMSQVPRRLASTSIDVRSPCLSPTREQNPLS